MKVVVSLAISVMIGAVVISFGMKLFGTSTQIQKSNIQTYQQAP